MESTDTSLPNTEDPVSIPQHKQPALAATKTISLAGAWASQLSDDPKILDFEVTKLQVKEDYQRIAQRRVAYRPPFACGRSWLLIKSEGWRARVSRSISASASWPCDCFLLVVRHLERIAGTI